MIDISLYILFVVFLLFSAFFSASEIAFMSINEIQIKQMLKNKKRNAKTIAKLKKNPHRVIISILIGNNIANVSVSAIATYIATDMFGSSGIGIAVGVMTFILLILGEVTPKTIATTKPIWFMKHSAKILEFSCILFYPIIILLNAIAMNISKLFGIELKKSTGLTEDQLKTAVLIGKEKGIIDKYEKNLMDNLFDFSDKKASEILTPKTKTIIVNANTTLFEFVKIVHQHRYSRYPVWENKEENIIGIVYAKDILANIKTKSNKLIKDFSKPVFFIHQNKEIGILMEEMRSKKQHLAIVVNEYGVVQGIITLEDIIEEIVGEIEDEKDIAEKKIIKINNKEYLADGLVSLDELKKIKIKLPSGNYNTLNGFIISKLNKIPGVGAKIKHKNYTFIVDARGKKRITKVRIKIK